MYCYTGYISIYFVFKKYDIRIEIIDDSNQFYSYNILTWITLFYIYSILQVCISYTHLLYFRLFKGHRVSM